MNSEERAAIRINQLWYFLLSYYMPESCPQKTYLYVVDGSYWAVPFIHLKVEYIPILDLAIPDSREKEVNRFNVYPPSIMERQTGNQWTNPTR